MSAFEHLKVITTDIAAPEAVEQDISTPVIEKMSEGIVVIDTRGTIMYANPAMEALFGYRASDMIGQNVSMLVPFPHRDRHDGYIEELMKSGKQAFGGDTKEVEGVRLDGTVFPVELTIAETRAGGARGFIGFVRDATERMEAERSSEMNAQVNRAINKVLDGFVSCSPWSKRELFEDALDSLLRLTQSEYGFIGEIHQSEDGAPFLKMHALSNIAWNKETRLLYKQSARTGMEFHNLDTLMGATIRSNEVVIANDPRKDPRSGDLPGGHPPLDSYMGVPIYAGNRFVGVAGVANRKGGYCEEIVDRIKPFLTSLGSIIVGFQNLDTRRKAERDLVRTQQKLRTMATEDLVTGIANRASLMESLEDAFKRCHELVIPLSVLFLDIDNFKAINDEHGHQIGDLVLQAVAERIKEIIRPSDMLGRFGGEEFLIGVVECVEADARATAERIREAIARKPIRLPKRNASIEVTVSVGVATSHRVRESSSNLIDRADRAMYAAKNSGRNCVRVNKLIEEV